MNCWKMSASAASRRATSFLRPAAALLVIIFLAGCAARRPAVSLPELGDWAVRARILAAVDGFEFDGRVGVRTLDDGFNGRLRWIQDGPAFEATVGGPLGIGTVRLEGAGESVLMTDNDGVQTELRDVEAELLVRYGWTIPVSSLRYWALGIPDPGAPAVIQVDAGGRLAQLEQRGWSVQITDYRGGGGQQMPYRLSASSADTRVRLVIDRWQFFE